MTSITGISKEKVAEFHARLIKRRDEIKASINAIKSDIQQTDETGADPIDVAGKIEERNRLVSDLAREENSLKRVEFSIRNFDDFGYCTDCGDDINVKRLEFDPASIRCVDCQGIFEIATRHTSK